MRANASGNAELARLMHVLTVLKRNQYRHILSYSLLRKD